MQSFGPSRDRTSESVPSEATSFPEEGASSGSQSADFPGGGSRESGALEVVAELGSAEVFHGSEVDSFRVDDATNSSEGHDDSRPNSGKRKQDSLLEVAVVVLLALVLALLVKTYVAEAYMIRGDSMFPTFKDGQRVMVQKVLYGDVMRGDVIIFASKDDPRKDLIKRVIGLPGENIKVIDGEVYINEERLEEDYVQEFSGRRYEHYGPEFIPRNKVFVLGDNRPASQDSRVFDAIDDSLVKGKVVLRWWPFEELRAF